jgi:hypothetical protein
MQPVINFDCLHLASIRFMFYFYALPTNILCEIEINEMLFNRKNLARATAEAMLWFTCVFNGIAPPSMHHRAKSRPAKKWKFPRIAALSAHFFVMYVQFFPFAINPSTKHRVTQRPATLSAAIGRRKKRANRDIRQNVLLIN